MADKDDVDLAVSDKILNSVATMKISLLDMANKAKGYNRSIKINSKLVGFNKAIYDVYLKLQKARLRVRGLNDSFPFKLGTSPLQSSTSPLQTKQPKQAKFSAAMMKDSSHLLQNSQSLKPFTIGNHAAGKPDKRMDYPAFVAGSIFGMILPKFQKLTVFSDQSPMSMVLQERLRQVRQPVSKPKPISVHKMGYAPEVFAKIQPYSLKNQTFLKTEMLNHLPDNKALGFSAQRALHVKPSVAFAARPYFGEQEGARFNQNHVPDGTRSGDDFAANSPDRDFASSVVAALLAALTPALQASGRGGEPMPVVIINPEDMHQSAGNYLTAQAGVQTGPTGFDYALTLAHPSGAYL